MKRAAFTICANNYLAAAKVLKNSFCGQHPDIDFFIVLVDRPDAGLDYTQFEQPSLLWIDDLVQLDIAALAQRFGISELCTTVKPFVFQHLFQTYDQVVYIDPDIKVYAPMTDCWEALNQYTFVLTPHLMNPVDDGKIPSDFFTLRTGIFNLGFLGLSKGPELDPFLKWWGERLLVYGYNDWDKGMFYDQIWAMYIPVMFNNWHILKHYGYNVANWNWHERQLTEKDGQWWVNDTYPLTFFHFSSYRYSHPETLCKYNTRYSRQNRPDLSPIFDDYQGNLTAAGAVTAMASEAYYHQLHKDHQWRVKATERTLITRIKRKLIKIIDRSIKTT
ncbi:hypothetical protein C8P68_102175 [Mucilaginibacter yixingensis]|uniref:Glycosyl transferase family 8 n=2 Tax=Mucilaginibacter yixingensis TaxID=1295612 RepID=A0A2T5JC66_9SPHI|nr:hypothetical protein C8P68_102175 [Mucilaginibacter yixingensis]